MYNVMLMVVKRYEMEDMTMLLRQLAVIELLFVEVDRLELFSSCKNG